MILEVFPSGPLETNAILVGCETTKEAAIVDAPQGVADELISRAKQLKLHLKMILLTHSHWDHIADAAQLKKQLNIPIFVHFADADNVERPGSDRLPMFFPIEKVSLDGYLTDGQEIAIGQLRCRVIHTPGHTPGGVCFYFEKQKTLISGDTLFRGAIGSLSLPTAQPSDMKESLKKLAALPPDTKVYPGHGPSTTIGDEQRIKNIQF